MKPLKLEKNNKLFWVYILVGVLSVLFSIILVPLWKNVEWAPWRNWSNTLVNLVVAVFLSLYIFGFLIKKVTSANGQTIKVLTIIEFVLLLLIDLYLILGQWIPAISIEVNGPCAIAGLALWVRGVIEIFRAYFHNRDSASKYPIWWLCVSIGFVSIGMWMLVKPFIDNNTLTWIFAVLFLALGILLIAYGCYSKPKTKK